MVTPRPPPSPHSNASFAHRFLNLTEMMGLDKECYGLVSAVSYSMSLVLFLGVPDREWWVPGLCRCSPHVNCTMVAMPTWQQVSDATASRDSRATASLTTSIVG
jgi:hypothetical protein